MYEELLKADNTDYEAHWGSVLCKFGIEYVDDPASGERKPTCHRTIADSIFADSAYRAALEYAPLDVREVYEREAAQIDRIQKDIIALSQREEKFDVFLCYKELDEGGNRTQDSVIAQELEFELSRRGYRVFFARKTLERVLGSAYEPVIYAALQSARAMVVLGTKPEHFQAVWVRNEWSRYRELIRQGAQKMLIPAYRGMSPYDLPMELSNLQALDMGKLGFVQDLCDAIDRFTRVSRAQPEPAAAAAIPQGAAAPGAEALIKRAFLFLEEGNSEKANEYFERVLDQSPEEPRAYLGKLMVEFGARSESDLEKADVRLDQSVNYKNVMVFGDEALKERIRRYNAVSHTLEKEKLQRAEETEKLRIQSVKHLMKRMPKGGLFCIGVLIATGCLVYGIFTLFMPRVSALQKVVIGLGGTMLGVIMSASGWAPMQAGGRTVLCKDKLTNGAALSELAKTAGTTEEQISADLTRWIQKGYFPGAYLSEGRLLFNFNVKTRPQSEEQALQNTEEKRDSSPDAVNQAFDDLAKKVPRGGWMAFLGTFFGVLFIIVAIVVSINVSEPDLWKAGMVVLWFVCPSFVLAGFGYARANERSYLKSFRNAVSQSMKVSEIAKKTNKDADVLRKMLQRWMRRGLCQSAYLKEDSFYFRFEEPAESPERLHAQTEQERQMVEKTTGRLPCGTVLTVLGWLAVGGVLIWKYDLPFSMVGYVINGGDFLYTTIMLIGALATLIIYLTLPIFLLVAGGALRKRHLMWNSIQSRVRSGATVCKLAEETCYPEIKLTKIIQKLIRKGYLKDVRLENGVIRFLLSEDSSETNTKNKARTES